MSNQTYIVLSRAGANRKLSLGSREQPYWNEHAAFIDALVDEHFILLGGPLTDEGGAMIVVLAESVEAVREKLNDDPWYRHGILSLERIVRWEIFVDQRT